MQVQPSGHDSVFHLFVITTERIVMRLIKYLNGKNIFPGFIIRFPVICKKLMHSLEYKKGDFPHSEYLADHCLSLPMYAELSDDEVDYVIDTLNSY